MAVEHHVDIGNGSAGQEFHGSDRRETICIDLVFVGISFCIFVGLVVFNRLFLVVGIRLFVLFVFVGNVVFVVVVVVVGIRLFLRVLIFCVVFLFVFVVGFGIVFVVVGFDTGNCNGEIGFADLICSGDDGNQTIFLESCKDLVLVHFIFIGIRLFTVFVVSLFLFVGFVFVRIRLFLRVFIHVDVIFVIFFVVRLFDFRSEERR